MKKIIMLSLVIFTTVVAITLIIFVFYYSFEKEKKYDDNNEEILTSYSKTIDISELLSGSNIVDTVNTKYSILYKNDLKRKMYVFSSPVRNQDGNSFSQFDRKMVEREDVFYNENSGLQISFQKDKIDITDEKYELSLQLDGVDDVSLCKEYTNCYGNTGDALKYSFGEDEMYASVTYGGILMYYEIDVPVREISFLISYGNLSFENSKAGYCVISDRENNAFVINQPIVSDTNGRHVSNGTASIKRVSSEKRLIITIPDNCDYQYPIRLSFIVDRYQEKMFYDSTAYSNTPNLNSIFNYISMYKQNESIDGAYTYMKFNMKSFTPKSTKLLNKAVLYLYALSCETQSTIEVYSVRNDWCSWELTWLNRPKYYEKIGEFNVSAEGWYGIDMTDYFIRVINDDYYNLIDNSIMLKIKTGSSGNIIFTSGDNTEAPIFFEIDYLVRQ